jgi:uncharacterized protein YlxP (DUF503 family)
MVVGTLELSLRLEGCSSLKDRRQILRSTMERARRSFSVSIAEVDDQHLWGNACIGVACVSNNSAQAESILQHVLDLFDSNPQVEVVGVERHVEQT